VCLVDTSVIERNLSRYLEIGSQSSSKSGPVLIKDRCIELGRNLWFAGPDLITNDSGSLLPGDEIAMVLGRLRTSFHYVLIDTKSTSTSRDAALFGSLADGAVLVIEADKTRREAARKAKELFEAAGVPLIGTILNNRSFPIPEALYKRI
jgi:Mrp family chromosome partitioning ATPase